MRGLILFASLALASCGSGDKPVLSEQEKREALREPPELSIAYTFERSNHAVLKDHESGCEYIVLDKGASGGAAITPRLTPEGLPHCEED